MSYNYLPLDNNPLIFAQITNLLDYNQLVSVTFVAHEKIIICRDYLDNKMKAGIAMQSINTDENNTLLSSEAITALQNQLLITNATVAGAEAPTDIVKIALMLKLKSLSMGFSGIDIETVKRLLEMYNNDIFPIAYAAGFDDTAVFSQLFLSLIGLGNVYYKGEKITAAQALKNMNWQPLTLKSKEALALITGNQYTNAYCLYQYKILAESKKLTDAQDDAIDLLLKAVNTLSDSIVINADTDSISYQTPDNTALIATLELLNAN